MISDHNEIIRLSGHAHDLVVELDECPQIDPKDPASLAEAFYQTHPWELRHHRGEWWLWEQSHYRRLDVDHLRAGLWGWVQAQGTFTPTPSLVKKTLEEHCGRRGGGLYLPGAWIGRIAGHRNRPIAPEVVTADRTASW